VRRLLARTRCLPVVGGVIRGKVLDGVHYRTHGRNGWQFDPGSSGPFGCDLSERWLSRDEVVAVFDRLRAVQREFSGPSIHDWYDIHATRLCPSGRA